MLFRFSVYTDLVATPQSYATELEVDRSWCKKIGFCNMLMPVELYSVQRYLNRAFPFTSSCRQKKDNDSKWQMCWCCYCSCVQLKYFFSKLSSTYTGNLKAQVAGQPPMDGDFSFIWLIVVTQSYILVGDYPVH